MGGRGSFRRRRIKVQGSQFTVQGSKVGVLEYRDRGVKGKVEVSGFSVRLSGVEKEMVCR